VGRKSIVVGKKLGQNEIGGKGEHENGGGGGGNHEETRFLRCAFVRPKCHEEVAPRQVENMLGLEKRNGRRGGKGCPERGVVGK